MSTTAALQTHRSKWPRFAPSATRAPKSVRPTQPEQILMAGLLGAKSYLQLVDIARVILHRQSTPDQTYYILGLPASSKYLIRAKFSQSTPQRRISTVTVGSNCFP